MATLKHTTFDALRRLRWRANSALGRDVHFRPDVRVRSVAVGGRPENGYGAWQVVTDGLGADSVVYAVGIGDDISFDRGIAARLGCEIHAVDPTPEALAWLETQPLPERYTVLPVALAAEDGEVTLFPHVEPGWVSHSMLPVAHTTSDGVTVPARRLATLMAEHGHGHVDLLKLDIEGAEYAVIDDLAQSGLDVRQILVEFHHRFAEIGPEATRGAVHTLQRLGYRIFHVSPRGEEYGFIHQSAL